MGKNGSKNLQQSSMNTIKSKIVQRLEIIPDDKLQEVLSFLNYLVWQTENPRTQEDTDWLESDLSSLDNYEPYEMARRRTTRRTTR